MSEEQSEDSLLAQLEQMNRRARLHLYPHLASLYSCSTESHLARPSIAIVEHLKQQLQHSPQATLTELNLVFLSLGPCAFTSKLFSRLYDLLVDNLLDSTAGEAMRIECATTLTLATLVSHEKVFHLCTHLFWLSFGEFYEESSTGRFIKSHLLKLMAVVLTLFDQDQFKHFVRCKMVHLVECLDSSRGQVRLAVTTCVAIVFSKFRGFHLLPPFNTNRDQINYLQLKIEVARIMQCLPASDKAYHNIWKLVEERDYVDKVVRLKSSNEVVKIDSVQKRVIFDLLNIVLANNLQQALKTNNFVRSLLKPQV